MGYFEARFRRNSARQLFAANDAKRLMEDQRTESSAMESAPKIARIRSRPAVLTFGFRFIDEVAVSDLELLLRFPLGADPALSKDYEGSLIVTWRSAATRRTSAARVAGIVTLCRIDLPGATLLLVAIVSG